LNLDLIVQKNCSTSKLAEEFVDFTWKPTSDLITIEEWIQIAIEVRTHLCLLLILIEMCFSRCIVFC